MSAEHMGDALKRNLWPDEEYQEELRPEDIRDIKNGRKRGYRHSLATCRGFLYRKVDRPFAIRAFAENPSYLEYAPRGIKGKATKAAEKAGTL